jgi:hypothetical protein
VPSLRFLTSFSPSIREAPPPPPLPLFHPFLPSLLPPREAHDGKIEKSRKAERTKTIARKEKATSVAPGESMGGEGVRGLSMVQRRTDGRTEGRGRDTRRRKAKKEGYRKDGDQ